MRTTVNLSDDVVAAVKKAGEKSGTGFSETVNDLVRRGLAGRPDAKPFTQRTRRIGLKLDVSNVADAIESLDGPDAP